MPFQSLMSGISSALNAQQANTNRTWQQRENQKDRNFNAQQASLARDWQSQQADKDRAYNTPANQMRLYQEAGLNPSLMMSNGASSISGTAPSASAAQSHGSSLPASQSANLQTSLSAETSAQVDLLRSGAQKNRADAEKAVSETENQKIQNYVDQATADDRISANHLAVTFAKLQNTLSEEQIKSISTQTLHTEKLIDKVNQEIEETKARISNIRVDTLQREWDNFYKYGTFGYQPTDKSVSISGISKDLQRTFRAGAISLVMQDLYGEKLMKSQFAVNMSHSANLDAATKQLDYDNIRSEYDSNSGIWKLQTDTAIAELSVRNGYLDIDLDFLANDSNKKTLLNTKEREAAFSNKDLSLRQGTQTFDFYCDKTFDVLGNAIGTVTDVLNLPKAVKSAYSDIVGSSEDDWSEQTTYGYDARGNRVITRNGSRSRSSRSHSSSRSRRHR